MNNEKCTDCKNYEPKDRPKNNYQELLCEVIKNTNVDKVSILFGNGDLVVFCPKDNSFTTSR
jgi:hypothetical protein